MLVERGINGIGRVDQDHRITVWRRLGDKLGREIVAGARTVLDDELLAEALAEPITEKPCQDVGRTAGRIANIDVRLTGRIVDRLGITQRDKRKAGRG